MNVRKFFNAKLGAWVFGSMVAWGSIAPGASPGGLFGGQVGIQKSFCNLTNQITCGPAGTGCTAHHACTCTCDFFLSSCPLTCTLIEGHNCPTSLGCTGPAIGSACMGGFVDGSCYY
jgi:hypothetical protein